MKAVLWLVVCSGFGSGSGYGGGALIGCSCRFVGGSGGVRVLMTLGDSDGGDGILVLGDSDVGVGGHDRVLGFGDSGGCGVSGRAMIVDLGDCGGGCDGVLGLGDGGGCGCAGVLRFGDGGVGCCEACVPLTRLFACVC